MSKPPRAKLEKVVEDQMPGYRIVPKKRAEGSRDSADAPKSDAVDLNALRRKYLRRSGRREEKPDERVGPERSGGSGPGHYDDAIVAVEPKDRSRDAQLPGGNRSKRVVISGDTNEIIGRQGERPVRGSASTRSLLFRNRTFLAHPVRVGDFDRRGGAFDEFRNVSLHGSVRDEIAVVFNHERVRLG